MNKKVNVLYIITKLELGGAQKVCLNLFKGLKQNKNFAGLISGSQGVLVDSIKEFDSVFLLEDLKREISFKNLFNEIKIFFKIIKIIKTLKKTYPDLIVHTHSTKAGLVGRWAAFFCRIKTRIHTVHGFGFHQYQNKLSWFINYFLEAITATITTQYICVCEYDQNIGNNILPTFRKKCSIIRAAVDFEQFYQPATKTDFSQENNSFIIGAISCFKPQKNIFDLLNAFKIFINTLPEKAAKNIYLEIIGDGILREEIETWIFFNNLEKNILLLGWQKDVSNFMKNWKIFAMSSLWEGLPCSIIEARLLKLPVISYKISGIPEVIINGKNGFLIQPGNINSLAKSIETLYHNNILRNQISKYDDDLTTFNNNFMINEHINLYNTLI